MTLERILDKLIKLGFTETEAQIYIYLAKKWPCEAEKLTTTLKLTEPELNHCLKSLKAKRIITSVRQRPPLFYAVSFEKLLELLMQGNIEQVKMLQENKKQLLAFWKTMIL
jgi:sugar-specific transcriptional regulator TrmB